MENTHRPQITPERIYFSRRQFLVTAGALLATTLAASACKTAGTSQSPVESFCSSAKTGPATDEMGNKVTTCNNMVSYNNYYEFTQGKDVAPLAQNFKTSPWTVEVGGLVNKPGTYSVAQLVQKFPPQERVYRMRCVEAWSAVVPWLGFPLKNMLNEAGPTENAKYVRFTGVYAPSDLPGQQDPEFPWPYVEGLRLDEAMNDLTLLVTGIYGKPLPPQEGAPIRLVVPWKYGFKSIKAITKIELVDQMPVSFWMSLSPNEYGFYSNVNPAVPHPRWSQDSERRLGEAQRIDTLLFNGYGDQVSSLYAGMDLRINF